jgi:hypothetical protein
VFVREHVSRGKLIGTGEVGCFIAAQHRRREGRDAEAAEDGQPEGQEPGFL